jgi:DNA-binding response OmpR family regulator
VLTAVDGLDGLEVARREPHDLVLLDAIMPRLDGVGFCRAYRAAGGGAPIVLMTAGDELAAQTAARACGAAHFVNKPFNISALLATVARFAGPV